MIYLLKKLLKYLEIKLKLFLSFLCFLLLLIINCNAQVAVNAKQNRDSLLADSLFKNRVEVYFKFNIQSKDELNKLTRIISIDNYKKNVVYAYANKKSFLNFLKLNYSYEILTAPSKKHKPKMLNSLEEKKNNSWNYYPSYPVYVELMHDFVKDYPALCRLDTIGILPSGRMLLAIIISVNPNQIKGKPRFLYTSTMHGDEPTGYILMLHLIDSLLSAYGNSTRITNLVNNVEIYINPLANPDGTYAGGDSTVYSATRYNASGVDLNRNYPVPQYGPHPDGLSWAPETVHFMAYATKHNFNMSANFHSGDEVVNYPWDTWAKLTADNNWWVCVSTEFADTIHKHGVSYYFYDLDAGVTDGYAWYQVTGGRQDYMNYFQHDRESTIELSYTKTPPADSLPVLWNYTCRSFLNYMGKSLQGIRGIVTDSVKGNPLIAKVCINGHDIDSSQVWSALPDGDYHRLIYSGNYNLTFSSAGYISRTINNVNVSGDCDSTTILNVKLVSVTGFENFLKNNSLSLIIYPNPNKGLFNVLYKSDTFNNMSFQIYDLLGKKVYSNVLSAVNGINDFNIDLSGMNDGLYFARLTDNDKVIISKIVIFH